MTEVTLFPMELVADVTSSSISSFVRALSKQLHCCQLWRFIEVIFLLGTCYEVVEEMTSPADRCY